MPKFSPRCPRCIDGKLRASGHKKYFDEEIGLSISELTCDRCGFERIETWRRDPVPYSPQCANGAQAPCR